MISIDVIAGVFLLFWIWFVVFYDTNNWERLKKRLFNRKEKEVMGK